MTKKLTLKDRTGTDNRPINKRTTSFNPNFTREDTHQLGNEVFFTTIDGRGISIHLERKGMMIGAYYEDQLIAFRAMLEPEIDADHLGIDAGIQDSRLEQVIYSEISNVDPDFRGNGLQSLLGQLLFQEVDERQFRYICTTVAPFNIASLKDKFALGMEIVALKEKYGNLLRYVFIKTISHEVQEKHDVERHYVDMGQTEEQQRYLREGWRGTGMERRADKWLVCYEK